MSESAAKNFIAKLKSDPKLREELSDHIGKSSLQNALDFAAKNGHEFSLDDLVSAYKAELKERGYSDDDINDLTSFADKPGHYSPPQGKYAGNAAPY